MSQHDDRTSFDGILSSIRTDEPSRAEIDAAADRVRSRLGIAAAPRTTRVPTAHIESCAGFQALIPDYLAGSLPRETALLLEDHSRECIPCRRSLMAARQPKAAPERTEAPSARPLRLKWAAAAAFAAVGVLGAYTAWQVVPMLGDPKLKVMRVDGSLFLVQDVGLTPLRPGMTVSGRDDLRTAKDSGALVMMEDGSRVEMRDRTELSVEKRRDGSTIRLGAGAIIVEASEQGSGHLDVRTDDCVAAVKGTIFAVNHGTRGSRVSVVEGAVHVAADGRESLLEPGDQMTTSEALAAVDVRDEIAWSKDADRYLQLLHEFAALGKDLDARVPSPAMRYGSRLLDAMPDGTFVYAAIPNLTASLVEARKVFDEHVAQSETLQAWWDEHMSGAENRQKVDEAFERLQAYGSQLGEEIVISLAMDADGHVRGPILTAEVDDPAALRKMLVKDLRKAVNGREIAREASLTFDGKVMRLEPSDRAKARVDGTWATSPLRAKLQDAYADGASWLFGADVKAMVAHAIQQNPEGDDALKIEHTGILDAEYVVFERTEAAGGAEHRAEISFDQPRRGVAGWLAAPAPLGAAEFVSPDASFAAAAVMKRPEILFAEALSWIGVARLHGGADLAPFQELAGTLGGDIAVAIDGPLLPVPSWKVAIEVYDSARFQQAFERLVTTANERIAAEGHQGRVVLEREEVGNRIDWVVRFTGEEAGHVPMRYTFTGGYLVAAPSQVLLDRAIEQRRNGYTLARSKKFQDLLPRDGQVNVSAAVWQHLGPVIGPLAGRLSAVVDSKEAREIEAMASESHPRLITAYAEEDRIVIGSRGEAGIGSLLGSVVSAREIGMLGGVLDRLHHAEAKGATDAP
jgi:ferric-dicitrate binding protein FerR (iron transport regulator)